MADREWLNRREAAECLGVSKPTVDKYIASGALKAYRPVPRGVVHIPKKSVEALLAKWAGRN
jgi:excisionase family DNA binding protein